MEAVVAVQEAEIPLSQIEIDPENVRSEYDPNIVTGLRSALQTNHEYINAPTVYPVGPDRYRVQHGSTRVLAAQGVLKKLRVRIVEPPPSQGSKLLAQMSENLLQGSLRPADIGNALKRLRYAEGRERSISQLVGVLKAGGIERTKSWVAMHLALAELAPEVQRLVNKGQLAAEAAYPLRTLPSSEQVAWAHRIVEQGLTREEVRRALGLGANEHDDVSPEDLQRELDERIRQAASESGPANGGRSSRADEQRHGTVVTRRELLPFAIQSKDARRLRGLSTAEWTRTATEVEKQLAQEALFMGGYSAPRAIELVQRATHEAQTASEAVMAGLNAARRLLEHPAELPPDSALAEFLAIRLRGVLRNLGRL
jgi:hypothetical protein